MPKPYIGAIMKKEVGSRNSDIWLLGDSNPKNWQKVLKTPLDPRHPARHNIWTPVLEVIQDRVFRTCRCRVDTSQIYVRNAVEDDSYLRHLQGQAASYVETVCLITTRPSQCPREH